MAQSYLSLVSETTRASVQRVSTRSPPPRLFTNPTPLTTPLVHQSPPTHHRACSPIATQKYEAVRPRLAPHPVNKRGQKPTDA